MYGLKINGNKIKIVKSFSDNEEGKVVANSIFDSSVSQIFPIKFCYSLQNHAQSRSFEEALIPFKYSLQNLWRVVFCERKTI